MLDAVRVVDGTTVMLKRISNTTSAQELDIHRHLLGADADPSCKQHIVPIYEVLQIDDSPTESIVVMPYLRPSSDPRFRTVEEAVEFFRQIFEVKDFTKLRPSADSEATPGCAIHASPPCCSPV